MTTSPKLFSPFAMIIFGATGDLSQRKLMPSLFHLFKKNVLPETFFIIGFSRRSYSDEDFREFVKAAIKKYHVGHSFEEAIWEKFAAKLSYQQGDFNQESGYLALIEKLKIFDEELKACVPRYFYLSTPPDQYSMIIDHLRETKLSEGCGQDSDKWTKVLIEKPFGRSSEDAQSLDQKLSHVFRENQIYRIDHYLGKETIQNMLAFRFGNTMFDPVWNNKCIDHVQITIAETVGVETRGNFYEGVGALRDMAQSHLLEMMSAIIMKQPEHLDADSIRHARAKSIESIVPIDPKHTNKYAVRGQYGPGTIVRTSGEKYEVAGYRQEASVSKDSNTETFVALKLSVEDNRWAGVPFYLRTGKRLQKKLTEIAVVFKEPNLKMFGGHAKAGMVNVLTFQIHPTEGIKLSLNAKKAGFEQTLEQIPLSFQYKQEEVISDAYEKLLLDALRGDQTLFTSTEEVAASWKLISSIADGWWQQGDPGFPNYEAGTWGPKEAEKLIEQDGREWLVK